MTKRGNNINRGASNFIVATKEMPSAGLVLAVVTLGSALAATAQDPPPQRTADLRGEVANQQGEPVAGARCTLTGALLASPGISVTSNAKGQFALPGLAPGSYTLTCAAMGYRPVVQEGIEMAGEPVSVQVVLPTETVLRQTIEVRSTPSTVTQESTAPPATLTSQQLFTLPLTEQKFEAALPLVPGVVRTPDGRIGIKGEVETQGILLVDSAETVDPVTGSFTIDVPVAAIESLNVYKTPYQAQYGGFSGGLTAIETKPPSSKWDFDFYDFMPDFRGKSGHLVGVADVKPKLYLTGPLWPNKLNFAEAFTWEVIKQPVRGLAWPHNETKTQGFTSFTNFQYIVSARQLLTASVDVFPLRREFANINSLVPQPASSNYGQSGYAVGVTDRYLAASGGILTTLVKYTRFSSYAHGQGPEDMLVTPNGWGGNFFDAWARTADQEEAIESFRFPRKQWLGQHEVMLGGGFVHRSYHGHSVSRPVLLERQDGSLAERIDFTGPATPATKDTEFAAFAQDHWALNGQWALDVGLRLSGETFGARTALGPRLGLLYSPGGNGKTIFRAGVGAFHDRVPLLASSFTQNPARIVQLLDAQGAALGPPVTLRNAYLNVESGAGPLFSARDLKTTPYNLTWSLEADRDLRPNLVARVSYLSSRTFKQFVIDPELGSAANSLLLLTNSGENRYYEFESTLRFRPRERSELNISYVHSRTQGNLNSLARIFVPFEQPVIVPDVFAASPFDTPNRLIGWGTFRIPWEITASPVLDLHTGFPYSNIDVLENYVGKPNTQRFPAFFSIDVKLTKDFRVPGIPWVKQHKLRGGLSIFNITDRANPRDVFNNVSSPFFGHFVGIQHRFFEGDVDLVF
ncbi:MAG: hypothetical protein DMG27_07495 [Acidobacteria bacterium]|nr:MAG: hypothetical protein DMG27_07495 [Acidobacteriota bacterium]